MGGQLDHQTTVYTVGGLTDQNCCCYLIQHYCCYPVEQLGSAVEMCYLIQHRRSPLYVKEMDSYADDIDAAMSHEGAP